MPRDHTGDKSALVQIMTWPDADADLYRHTASLGHTD